MIKPIDPKPKLATDARYPSSLTEAVDWLMELLSEDQLQQVEELGDTELECLHFSLGAYIRNTFGLWGENPALLKDCGREHPDDAYVVILQSLIERLREERGTG